MITVVGWPGMWVRFSGAAWYNLPCACSDGCYVAQTIIPLFTRCQCIYECRERRYPIPVKLYKLGAHQGSLMVVHKPYCCIQGGVERHKEVLRPPCVRNWMQFYKASPSPQHSPSTGASVEPVPCYPALPFIRSGMRVFVPCCPVPSAQHFQSLTPRTSPSRSPCSLGPLFRLLLFSI